MHTGCNAESIAFTPLANRAVTAAFDAGAINPDGGVLLLQEVEGRINLFDRADTVVVDPRNREWR